MIKGSFGSWGNSKLGLEDQREFGKTARGENA